MVDTEVDIPTISNANEQSQFAASQALLQAPPHTGQERPNKRKMWLLIGLGLFIIFTTLVILGAPRRTNQPTLTEPNPTPTPMMEVTPMQQQINLLNEKIHDTNPDDVLESPPKLDMAIQF